MNRCKKITACILALMLALGTGLSLTGCGNAGSHLSGAADRSSISSVPAEDQETSGAAPAADISGIPEYSGEPYVAVNDNIPSFDDSDMTAASFEEYSPLDNLGRCGAAYADIGEDLMPTEDRGSISDIEPTGWHNEQYSNVDGGYVYNRCHLIGHQLTAEDANRENLITGTRYLNIEGMLPFENMVADYIHETGNHVLYRVTPVFEGDNLVASGVQMEAMSVEDEGDGVLFNVYCYNVQPGVKIDYASGYTEAADEPGSSSKAAAPSPKAKYILNTSSDKFHLPSCSSVKQMSPANTEEFSGTRDELISMGYEPCGRCHP